MFFSTINRLFFCIIVLYGAYSKGAEGYAPLENVDLEPFLAREATISFARFRKEVNIRNQLRVKKKLEGRSFLAVTLKEITVVSHRVQEKLLPEVEELARENGKLAQVESALSNFLASVEELDAMLQSLKGTFGSFTREDQGRINEVEISLRAQETEILRPLRALVDGRLGCLEDDLYKLFHSHGQYN